MGLFKSKDERRLEREMKIRQGMKSIERSIRQQEKFAEDFIKNAMLIQQQAQASQQFAESMNLMAGEIGRVFGEMDLTKTQAQWERAVAQAGSMEERMEIFLDSMESTAIAGGQTTAKEELVTDDEIDRMIHADVLAAEKQELGKLDELESEIAKELGATKQKD
jgi:hypothetical protein